MGDLWNNDDQPRFAVGESIMSMAAHTWDVSIDGDTEITPNITSSVYELDVVALHPNGVQSREEFEEAAPDGRAGTIGVGDPFMVLRFRYTPGVP
jgi:hypothetical protein